MTDNLAIKALVKAQTEMGAVLKNAQNPHLKRKYADLGAVIDAVFPALHANGFAVIQPAGADDMGQYVETIFAHESGERFSSRVYLVIGKQDMQGVGSAHTYARRYGLLAMAGVAPEDDDGECTKRPPAPRNTTQDAPPPPFDPAACEQRLRGGMAKLATKQQASEWWKGEADARIALKANATKAYDAFYADFAKLSLRDDPARQAPPPKQDGHFEPAGPDEGDGQHIPGAFGHA